MKSMILKDIYNIRHNSRSMVLVLAVLAAAFIPSSGAVSFVYIASVMCSMMIITTFAFDDNSGWNRYAAVMPVSRNEIVMAKFIVLAIFSAAGALAGAVIALIGSMIINGGMLSDAGDILCSVPAAAVIAVFFGSISIPLVFRFGAEKSRALIFAAYLVPAGVCFGIYKLLCFAGVEFTDKVILILLAVSPAAVFLWCMGMYVISKGIFDRAEL